MFVSRSARVLGVLVLAASLWACDTMREQEAKAPATLYERLGGQPAITAVVDTFVANIAADTRINHRFMETDITRLKRLLVEQICEATGGPCTYTGRNMVSAHRGQNISEDEFNWTGGHLVAALDKYNVPEKEKNELLAAFGAMAPDIIGK